MSFNPDGVFLSNGPGDPSAVTYGIEMVRSLLGKKPIFGICLGHQILSLALGAKTYKLKSMPTQLLTQLIVHFSSLI